jgi:hypothetical protein
VKERNRGDWTGREREEDMRVRRVEEGGSDKTEKEK